jgi:CHAT domain-containing protein/tetratricopeptide (TPR) repeat protein
MLPRTTVFFFLLATALTLAIPAAHAAVPGFTLGEPVPRGERKAVDEIQRLIAQRQFPAADSLARALVVRSESRKRGTWALADALDLHAAALRLRARPNDPDFVAVATRAVSVREADAHPDPARLAAALRTAGIARIWRIEYATADSLFSRAIAVLDAAPVRDSGAIAIALTWRAEALRSLKNLKLSVETAHQAIAALARHAPSETTAAVRVHTTLGNTLAEQGETDAAIAALTRALAIEESRAAPDSASLGAIARFLGRANVVAGNSAAGAEWYERAVSIQERVLGPWHSELATTLYLLSYAQIQAGDPLGARRTAERAVRIREKVFGPDHVVVAIARWQVGSALRELGDLDGALAQYERSVSILRALNPPRPGELAIALNNLGAIQIARGEGAAAHAAFDESIAIREKTQGPGAGRSFWALTRLAQALTLEGRSREGAAILDTLLAGGLRHTPYDRADALTRRATAAWAEHDLATAHTSIDRAFVIHDSLAGGSSTRTLESLTFRAALRWALGRRDEAFADARRSEQSAVDVIRSGARSLSESEALAFEGRQTLGREVMMAMAADSIGVSPESREAAFDAVVRSRLAVLDEQADEARALPRDDAALAPLVRELDDARAALARTMVEALRDDRPPDSLVAAARVRRENAERALAERSSSFRTVTRRAGAGGAEVAAALPAGSALVSYLRYHDPHVILDEETPAGPASRRRMRYAALVLRAGQHTPVIVPLGDAAALETTVDGWVAALATPPATGTAAAEASRRRCDAIGRAVRERLWDPVARQTGKAERVFVVPDGVLHGMNFAALPDKGGAYLVEKGPLLLRLIAERDLLPWSAPAAGTGLLALGGADFDHVGPGEAQPVAAAISGPALRSAVPDSLRIRFTELPQTATEVAELGRIWREAGMGEPLELVGPGANEAAFKRLASGRRFLHLATHGFALGAQAPSAAPGTRGIGGVGSGAITGPRRTSALLPGLALAGANAPADSAGEDGFLTAEEITALDLSSVDWAVLSACETGRSDRDAVEAVQGLHRSFRRAGARTVIVSLWAVDDAATRAWMGHLYRARLLRKTDTADAMREASRAMLAERRKQKQDLHPFHWAAFVASGDWR